MTFALVPPGTYVDAEGFGPYRYLLLREWNPAVENLAVVMLNPSTADEYVDDPTIRRVTAFAKRDGWGGIAVLNLYAWRATVPADLERDRRLGIDVVGPENDAYLRRLLVRPLIGFNTHARPRSILVAWGTRAEPERVAAFRALLPDNPLLCLGVTKEGHPRHPLYVRGDTPMIPWTGDAPNRWSPDVPPGGEVCAVCGMPTETIPCAKHQPRARASADA